MKFFSLFSRIASWLLAARNAELENALSSDDGPPTNAYDPIALDARFECGGGRRVLAKPTPGIAGTAGIGEESEASDAAREWPGVEFKERTPEPRWRYRCGYWLAKLLLERECLAPLRFPSMRYRRQRRAEHHN